MMIAKIVFIVFLCCGVASSQELQTVKILAKAKPVPAGCKPADDIVCGQGVVVYVGEKQIGVALTARHVLINDSHDVDTNDFVIKYSDGRKSIHCRQIHEDAASDIAAFACWVPATVQPISVGDSETFESPFFVGQNGKRTAVSVSLLQSKQLFCDGFVRKGDSGSGLFDDGKLVGIVSGGWFWLERDNKTTWPLRFGRPSSALKTWKIHENGWPK